MCYIVDECLDLFFVDEQAKGVIALKILCEALTPKTSKNAVRFIYNECQVFTYTCTCMVYSLINT